MKIPQATKLYNESKHNILALAGKVNKACRLGLLLESGLTWGKLRMSPILEKPVAKGFTRHKDHAQFNFCPSFYGDAQWLCGVYPRKN